MPIVMLHCRECSADCRPHEVEDGICPFCEKQALDAVTGEAALEALQGWVNESDGRGNAWDSLDDSERFALAEYDAPFATEMERESAANSRHRYGV